MGCVKYVINPFTGEFDAINKPTNQAPKLIATFNTTALTLPGNLVRVSGDNFVEKITSNLTAEIPNGVFGVCYSKPSSLIAEVIFVGIMAGYAGLTIGQPVFIDTSGLPTHTPPNTGMVQQVGFAISSSEIFINILQPMRRG